MRSLLLGLLLMMSVSSVALAVGDGDSNPECTVNDADFEAFFAQNQENYGIGKPACGCITKVKEGGSVESVDHNGNTVKYCVDLQEPIAGIRSVGGNSGVDLFSSYIQQLYIYGASIIGIICVLVIVVSGVQITLGGANSEFVNQGKERILAALFSLILLFSSGLILRTVNPGFFETGNSDGPAFIEDAQTCPLRNTQLASGDDEHVLMSGTFDSSGNLTEGKASYRSRKTGKLHREEGVFVKGELHKGTYTHGDGTKFTYEGGKCVAPLDKCIEAGLAEDPNTVTSTATGVESENKIVVTASRYAAKTACRYDERGQLLPPVQEPAAGSEE